MGYTINEGLVYQQVVTSGGSIIQKYIGPEKIYNEEGILIKQFDTSIGDYTEIGGS